MPLFPQPRLPIRSVLAALVAAPLLLALSGCATPPPADDPDAVADFHEANDPLEPTNRVLYAINNGIDTVVMRPVAKAYRAVLPQVVRTHVHNVLVNINMPGQLFNDMLEGKPRHAGDSLMRVLLNTTVGIGGVFDVATDLGWPDHDADSGVTLALWGIPNGPFLFLPILGPSSPREITGFGADIGMNPLTWVGHGQAVLVLGYAQYGIAAVDARAAVLDDLDKITAQALDPYATIRSLYRQHRESVISDARTDGDATVPAWFPAAPSSAGAGPRP